MTAWRLCHSERSEESGSHLFKSRSFAPLRMTDPNAARLSNHRFKESYEDTLFHRSLTLTRPDRLSEEGRVDRAADAGRHRAGRGSAVRRYHGAGGDQVRARQDRKST